MIHKLRGRCYGGVCILLCAAALLVLGGNLHGVAASPSLQNAEYERISLQPEALSWTADLLASAQASHDPEADSTPASDQTEWTPSHQNEAISYHSFADGGISAGSLSAEQAAKLDPYLRLGHYLWNMRQQAGEDQTGKAEVADAADEGLEQVVTGLAGQIALYLDAPEPGAHVLVQTTDDARALEALDISVQARLGDVATAFLPYERLAEVASLPSVVRIEASQLLHPSNDASVPEARAPQVWSGYGSTGAGVVVGVIDSGIDPFHTDFIKPDGSTRIKFMLDLSDPGDPDSDGNLNGPVFGGTMYTEAQINAALANPGWFYLSADTPKQIPDNSPAGISSQINVTQNVSVNSAAVELYILHPFRGDLRVTLTCPSGTNVSLSSNTGGSRDHIIGTFPITACNGQNAGGAWRLTVADTARGDTGGLVFWNLHLNRTVRMTDQVGHGTHVAGSAAGNGRGAGSGAPAGGFKGMAPDADLIIVRGATDYIGGPSTSATVNAMTFIDERAQALSKPYVINMSFGGQIGPHDGTSLHERAIDNQVGSGKPGKAIVVAAGNEGARHIHATDTVPPGGMKELTFDVSGSGLALIDIWYPGADTFKVGFRDPTGGGIDPTPLLPGQNDCWTGGGNSICIASVGNDPHNGDKSVFVLIGAGTSGRWRVKLYGHAVTNGRFDAWISGNEFTSSNVADRMRVGMPGTARNAITVGAYTTKTQWIDASGTPHSISATLGNYAAFSSDGPTRDGRQKPELSAPGQRICSTLAAQAPPGAYGSMYANANYICQGGQHGIVQGTSMAAPHVAGAVALLLSLDRSLDAQQLRNTLTGAARTDSFTGAAPNIRWGYGKLDVQAAAQALSPANTPTPTPTSTVTLPPANTPTPTPTSTVTLPPANTPTPTPTSTVTLPPPIVNAIVPNSGENTGSVAVLISGANFQAGATVKLTATGQPDIHATGVIVASSSQIVANLNLTGAATGAWNVVVTNPNAQSGILPNGFTIIFPGKTWTGAISADWHTSGNWTPSGVPGGGDDVVIPAVIRAPVISNGNATVRNLTINSGGILDLTVRTLWVEGRLSNNGALSQTRDVSVGELAHFLRITNQAGTQTKYHGLEFTPAQIGDPGVGHAASGPIYSESLPPDEGSRWVELTLDSLPARSDTTDLATSPQAPDATISLVVDDGQHETAVGVNNNNTGKAFQFIWLNRFTPAPAAYPFALNEIWVMFDAFGGGANVRVGDAIDLVIYQDPDGNPANGANWVATVRESVKAVDGTTWSVYALASPVLLDGPGDVLIAVINRYITSGVSPVAYPATLDRTTGQNRSWIGWWSSNPPSPPLLPPNTRFSLMTGDSAGNWLIRGYGETQSAATPTPSPTPTATLTVTLPTTPTATATSTPTGTIPPPTPTATPTPTGTAQPTSERVTVSISGSQFCAGRTRGVKRCYDINPTASMVATVRFYFSETERSGQPLNDLMVFCYDGDWKEEPGPYARGGAGDALYVETQNVAGFSFFALGRSGPEMLYLPLVLKQVPVGTPTPTPTPTRTQEPTPTPTPTRTPTPTPTTEPGACPQTGRWSGTTSQGRAISFNVENISRCQIAPESLRIQIRDSCGFVSTTTFHQSHPVVNNRFQTGSGSTVTWVRGDFVSSSTASGTFNFYSINPYEPWRTCTASGTWTATP